MKNKTKVNKVNQRNLTIKDWREISRIMRQLQTNDTAALVAVIEGQRQQRNIFFD